MKRLILVFCVLLGLVTSSQAFESGSYECVMMGGMKITYVLKPNGRAKSISNLGTVRGNWQDDDDAALVITKDNIIENKGNGKYLLLNDATRQGMLYGVKSYCKKTK